VTKEDGLRVKMKLDELKKKRAGKEEHIKVSKSNDRSVNFANCMDELQKILQYHELAPLEIELMRGHLTEMAASMRLNMMGNNIDNFFREKGLLKDEKEEVKDEKVRVKPGDKLEEKQAEAANSGGGKGEETVSTGADPEDPKQS